jgi:type IX secretion system PorP/SprF family membrane protein
MRFIITYLLLFFFALSKTAAQDPHFTQYYSAPMLMNPALTGFFNGDVRVSSCYRSQWPSIQYPYITGTVSADANALKSYIKDGDIFGVGFTGLFDKSNNGGLKTNSMSASVSFHKLLDQFGVNRLGVGAMATYNTRLLDYSKFVFGQQLTPLGFNNNLPTGEPINGFTTNYVDYSVGIVYSAITDFSSFYSGIAIYHFNQPEESFNGPAHKIAPRISANAGGSFMVGESNKMFLSAAYMKAEFTSDLIFGAAFSKTLSQVADDNYYLILGGWYRFNDAVSPYVGLEYKNLRGGLSYDVNVSKLTPASQLRGGFELTLNYIFTQDPEANALRQTLCPRGSSQLRWFGY